MCRAFFRYSCFKSLPINEKVNSVNPMLRLIIKNKSIPERDVGSISHPRKGFDICLT
jgi:hypothetical protein